MEANKLKSRKPSAPVADREQLRIRTGLKAGDIYMQHPRGSNNGSNGGG